MSGSKQTQTQKEVRDPYSPAKPAINQSIGGIQQWLSDPKSGAAFQGGMSDWTQQGLQNLGTSAGANQARDYTSGVLSGDYLNAGNPYQKALDDSIISATMPSINATFSNAGMSGSTAHQGMLSQGITSALAAPRYQNYQMERGNQMTAAGLLPQLDAGIAQNQLFAGQTSEGYDRAKFDEERLAGLRPYLETQGLLQGYGQMGGTSTSTQTNQTKPSLGQTLGGIGMAGLGMATGMPGFGMIGSGIGNVLQGKPYGYGSTWEPLVTRGG